MTLLIFLVAIAIWSFLDRQSVRHKMEMEIECAKAGRPHPPIPPGMPTLEAWLNITLGAILAGFSILSFGVLFLNVDRSNPAETGRLGVVIFALGFVMMGLGAKGVRERKARSQRARAPKP